MKKRIIKKVSLFLSGILLISALTGCSSTNDEKSKDKKDDLLVIATANDIGDLNAHGYSPMYGQNFLYDGLTSFEDGEVKPCLAQSWDISDDGKEYTFHLRKDVKFTDGSDFNAEIVKKNFDAFLKNKDAHAFLESVNLMDSVEVVDDYTVKIKYTRAYYPILQELALSRPVRFMAKASFPKDGDTSEKIEKPIGTGMWKLKEYKAGEYSILERNEDYWGEKPKFKEVKMVVTPDGDTSVNALKAGEVDMIFDVESRLSPDAFEELKSSGFGTYISDPLSTVSLIINATNGPTKNLKVREALQHAVDKDVISEHVFYGLQKPADTFFNENVPYCDLGLPKYEYDLEKANKLLDEAGWTLADGDKYRKKDGKELELGFYYDGENVIYKSLGEVLQSEYAKVGIKINLGAEERQVLIDRTKAGDFDITITETWGDPYDPHTLVAYMKNEAYADYQAQKGLSMKAEIDDKITKVIVEGDEKVRQDLYKDILTTLHEQCVYLPISNTTRLVACDKDLEGVKFNTLYYIPIEDVTREGK
ncbi:MAG: nickel ABC transporter substrate-binding protein [Terrisporobacter sp.]|uniref:nickel ABC transporter substrate-binding protein n=1 Tax=Terrisporobacter sp. TaxID=1965305 RepID=UPI002FCB880E